MIHTYKCKSCGAEIEDNIPTYDIVDSKGIVDQKKLSERISMPRTCVCGGLLVHKINSSAEVYWFNDPRRGKISNRFGK